MRSVKFKESDIHRFLLSSKIVELKENEVLGRISPFLVEYQENDTGFLYSVDIQEKDQAYNPTGYV